MASQLLRAPEKGARQQAMTDDQQLELRTQMAAHYLRTDHDTDGGRLIQGQVDHTLLVGHRVRTSTEELEKLRAEFGTDQLQLEKCPVCQRTVTHGEFGVDHIMFYLEGDEERETRKVRSTPRIWCGPCAKAHAKRNKKPYLRSRTEESLREAWQGFVSKVREGQGQDVDGEALVAEPGNEQTAKLWAWLGKVLISKDFVEVAKARFRVSNVQCSGDVDLENRCFAVDMTVTYECVTKLVTGEEVQCEGSSVVVVALKDAEVSTTIKPGGSAQLTGYDDPSLVERATQKVELAARIWAKKAVPKLVVGRLGDLKAKALKLVGAK